MKGNLRFALTALTWAVILLAIYAFTARAQTVSEAKRLRAQISWRHRQAPTGLPVIEERVVPRRTQR